MGVQGTVSPKVFLSGHSIRAENTVQGSGQHPRAAGNELLDGEHHLGSTKGSLPLFVLNRIFLFCQPLRLREFTSEGPSPQAPPGGPASCSISVSREHLHAH